jgi:hypothetical protein
MVSLTRFESASLPNKKIDNRDEQKYFTVIGAIKSETENVRKTWIQRKPLNEH